MKEIFEKNKLIITLFFVFLFLSIVFLVLYITGVMGEDILISRNIYDASLPKAIKAILIFFHDEFIYIVCIPLSLIWLVFELYCQYCLKKHIARLALLFILSVSVAAIFALLTKKIFGRQRPQWSSIPDDYNSFPSGSTIMTGTIFLFFAVIAFKNRWRIVGIVLLFVPIIWGIGRIWIGEHYLFDVIAAWLFVPVVLSAVYLTFLFCEKFIVKVDKLRKFIYGEERLDTQYIHE
ncbi:MAG: phosphatase PAP2 family protein [Clostridiales bacterium]|jgi:membrane-associated phospholipid phosphatase|nr:phosphatase PAP2 family protein [Clostridiales bacterium]